ncbi:MAG: serpin family protein [Clostridiaceae bacterium]|nr:serpin family protein [Clostridiaceae bacterium]
MKRWISILLSAAVLCMCLSVPATAAAVPGEAKAEAAAASRLSELGLFRGTQKGFELSSPATRAQAVTMLVRLLGAEKEALDLTDVGGHWAKAYIAYAEKNGFAGAVSATAFSPDDAVTGAELTQLLLVALGYEDVTLSNAYDTGVEAGLLSSDALKAAANDDRAALTRGMLASFSWAALSAKMADGTRVWEALIDQGVFKRETFDPMSAAADAETDFAESLLRALDDGGNVTVSPLSVKLALAMAANGAEGETKTQMLSALGISDLDAFNKDAAALIDRYNGKTDVTVSIANALFLNEDKAGKTISIQKSFADIVADFYRAEAFSVTDQNAVKTVNDWVSGKTSGKIQDLISSSDFLACLVNAVYLKADWALPFNPDATADGGFTGADGKTATVPLMHMTKTLSYYEEEGLQIVRLPYADGETSMLIALGDYDGDLADYLPKLTPARVAVTLPRFTIEYGASLKDALAALGMERCFTDSAEFGAMVDGAPVRISDVVHKTFLSVTEEGTEAAAATAVMIEVTSFIEDPVEFRADRPFAWCILDETTGETLFCGRVNTLA